jgi:hypothetical protein
VKRDDWLEQLWATLKAAEERPFYYGACVALAAECVDATTGSDFRQAVQTLIEAAHAEPMIELAKLEAFVTERLGEPIPMHRANRGDVVLLETHFGPALGICTGDRIACAGDGVVYLKRARGLKAWAT